MKTVDISEKFDAFTENWHPYIIGELNENYVKLAKLRGDFVWHSHAEEDELFIVMKGKLRMDFRESETVTVGPGQMLVVPKGVEHRPYTENDEEVHVLLVEPRNTKHTGEVETDRTVNEQTWI